MPRTESAPTPRRWSTPPALACCVLAMALGAGVARWRPAATTPAAVPSAATRSNTASGISTAPSRGETAAIEDWHARWDSARTASGSPVRTRNLAALLEQLARTDPKRALELALAEKNWLVRDQLRNAALRGWGATDPDAASAWAMAQPELADRMHCGSAVLTGAAENPEAARRVGLELCAKEPQLAGDFGHHLINALVAKSGSFEDAARFATSASMVDRQSYLLDSAYYQWAQHDPERALAALNEVADPAARLSARKGIIEGFADANPQQLADLAAKMPEGEERSAFLEIALPRWVGKDPDAALNWIQSAEPNPDNDKGVAALALAPAFAERNPRAALELTDNICDSARRVLTKSNVFIQWARREPAAARAYAEALENPEYRTMLLEDWTTVTSAPGT